MLTSIDRELEHHDIVIPMMEYRDFLSAKLAPSKTPGIAVDPKDLHPGLYDFQRAVTAWALQKGRAAIWADCGLGKSQMQLEWARIVSCGGPVLIFAPLCVGAQTLRIAQEFGIQAPIRQIRESSELGPGINIANYEMAHKFANADLWGIVLDESSILKSVDGKTKALLLESFSGVPYRICCTATPCPNDISELANHAEFLGIMKRSEMLATFFVHDDEGWRLRGHAREPFYRWLATWAMAFKSPNDIGFDGSRFILPALQIEDATVTTEWRRDGELFPGYGLKGIKDRISVRRISAPNRVRMAAILAMQAPDQVIIWCGLNQESREVAKAIPGAVEINGSDKPSVKEQRILAFLNGETRVLVTKLRIAGYGLNFQCADTMIFLGMSDSYEQYYQGIRRLWRYGQTKPVTAWIVVSDHEKAIVENVRRKEQEADSLTRGIIDAMKDYEREELRGVHETEDFEETEGRTGDGWIMYRGDCVEVMTRMDSESVDLSIHSPPFASLYTYSASERDMGNCSDMAQFAKHYRFAVDELLRLTKPGRLAAVHCQQIATALNKDGFIGLRDFRGELIRVYQDAGWIYHGEVCIQKNPQAQAVRTHAKGLLFVQLHKDSAALRPALADYILLFLRPGKNEIPIKSDVSNEEWIKFAAPVWYDIQESDTLNTAEGRDDDDERHICALQLETIRRCLRLWSNPGELVLSPFAGIGSEGYVALQNNRQFAGIELKPRYFETACLNMQRALAERKQGELFA